MSLQDYLETNRTLWNEWTKHHLTSEFYDMDSFLKGQSSLNDIELDLLGDVSDKSVLHLQCHFGQDTLSLARRGARTTGIDLSPDAIAAAKELNAQLGLQADFVCSDLYELPSNLQGQFDIVFTSYGTITWMPDLERWAKVVSHFLKPGGQFLIVEFHPAVWIFDNDFTHIQYAYFNKDVIIESESGSYADRNTAVELQSVTWNHALSEVMQNLINAGLSIKAFQEYDYSPYPFVSKCIMVADDRYMIKGFEGKLPLVYAIKAVKD